MPNERDEAARTLAAIHYAVDPGITEIFRIERDHEAEPRPVEPIVLLDINENTIAVGIQPLRFGPLPERGISFPSIIVEVTPEEFDRIRSRELPLPKGWAVGELIPRPLQHVPG